MKRHIQWITVLACTVICSCTSVPKSSDATRIPAQHPVQVVPLDTQMGEYIVPGEAEATLKLHELFAKHMIRNYQTKKKTALRAVHAKSHGCLNGQLTVIDHGDPELKFGVFKQPATYPVKIRFSNGDGPPSKDSNKLVSLGMAIKLSGVKEQKLLTSQREDSQDFLMINQPAFLVKDITEFADVIEAREAGFFRGEGVIGKAIFGIKYHSALAFRKTAHPKGDPLNTTFWSALAFRIGNTAVKYIAVPCGSKHKNVPKELTPDYLTVLLKEHAEREAGCYDIFLQKRLIDGKENEEMPIENARVIWDEKKSVPIKVAQLTTPIQTPEIGEQGKACEDAQFSPWNTTQDFRPLGNLNRVRRTVYDLSASERHRINEEKALAPREDSGKSE